MPQLFAVSPLRRSICAQFEAKPAAVLKKNKLQSADEIQEGMVIRVTKVG